MPFLKAQFKWLTSRRCTLEIRTVSTGTFLLFTGLRVNVYWWRLGMTTLPTTTLLLPKCTTISMYVYSASMFPPLSLERYLGSFYSSETLQGSIFPLKVEALTPKLRIRGRAIVSINVSILRRSGTFGTPQWSRKSARWKAPNTLHEILFKSLNSLMILILSIQERLTRSLVNECASTGSNVTCSAADNYCADNVESIYDKVLNRDEYDIRELEPDP